jgi:hypothetical protein
MCRFQSVEFFGSFGGLLDQGASLPKMKKEGCEGIEGAGRIPSGKTSCYTSRQLPSSE